MRSNKTILNLAITASLFSVSQFSSAAGFQLAEYSATGLGRAYAGEAAMADNASAQWRNPAMLTYLKGTQISGGLVYVDPNVDIDGSVTDPYTGQTYNATSSDYAEDGLIPNLYVSHAINDRLVAGIAFGTNYAMETNLDDDFAASHHGNEASITTMEANLNLGYKLTDTVSIGGGVRYVMGEGSIGAEAPTQTNASTGVSAGTTLKYMEGDATEWGWQAGAAWQITPEHRVGVTYKSEVELKLEGYATGIGFGMADGDRDSGYLPLALPATAEIASFHQLTERFAMHASINWTDWSAFDKLEATLDTYGTQLVKEENWEDSYRFAIGATYQVAPKWVTRTGIAYDTSAADDDTRTITIPETDRTWLSVGAGYQWSEQLTFDAGITYIIAKDASITESDSLGNAIAGAFTGEATGNVLITGVQASYTF